MRTKFGTGMPLAGKSKPKKFQAGGDVVGELRANAEASRRAAEQPIPSWRLRQLERERQDAAARAGVGTRQVYRAPSGPVRDPKDLTDDEIRSYLTALQAEQGVVAPRLNVGRRTIPASSPYTARELRLEQARRAEPSPRMRPFEADQPDYGGYMPQAAPSPAARVSQVAVPAAAATAAAAAARRDDVDPEARASRTPSAIPVDIVLTAPAGEQPAASTPAPAAAAAAAAPAGRRTGTRRSAGRRSGELTADELNQISLDLARGQRMGPLAPGAEQNIARAMGYKKGGLVGRKAGPAAVAKKPVAKKKGGMVSALKAKTGRPVGRPASGVKPLGTNRMAAAMRGRKTAPVPAFKKGGKVSAKGKKK